MNNNTINAERPGYWANARRPRLLLEIGHRRYQDLPRQSAHMATSEGFGDPNIGAMVADLEAWSVGDAEGSATMRLVVGPRNLRSGVFSVRMG